METGSASTMVEFIRYNNWANQQVLAACQKLDDAQLAASAPGTYGTIRDTLEHIIRAEAGYLRLLTGNRLAPPFRWEDKPGVSDMTAYAVQVGDALIEAVQRVQPTEIVSQEWEGKIEKYQAVGLFIQIINHGIEHRTNITTIMVQAQLTPPEVDGWSYMWSNSERLMRIS